MRAGDDTLLGDTNTGGGTARCPPSMSCNDGTYSWGLGMGEAGTAGNAAGETVVLKVYSRIEMRRVVSCHTESRCDRTPAGGEARGCR